MQCNCPPLIKSPRFRRPVIARILRTINRSRRENCCSFSAVCMIIINELFRFSSIHFHRSELRDWPSNPAHPWCARNALRGCTGEGISPRVCSPAMAEANSPFFRITCFSCRQRKDRGSDENEWGRLARRKRDGEWRIGALIACRASRMFGQRELNNAFTSPWLPGGASDLPGRRLRSKLGRMWEADKKSFSRAISWSSARSVFAIVQVPVSSAVGTVNEARRRHPRRSKLRSFRGPKPREDANPPGWDLSIILCWLNEAAFVYLEESNVFFCARRLKRTHHVALPQRSPVDYRAIQYGGPFKRGDVEFLITLYFPFARYVNNYFILRFPHSRS